MNQVQNVGIICILILRKEYVTIRKLYFYKLYSLSFIKDKFKRTTATTKDRSGKGARNV